MTNKQYEQLKSKIIEAVPGIVKLEFGCKILAFNKIIKFSHFKENKGKTVANFVGGTMVRPPATPQTMVCITKTGGLYYYNTNNLKIIGRDIKLADVLIALAKNNIVSELGIFVDVMGRFWTIESCSGKNEMKIVGRWELFRGNNSLDWHYKHQLKTCEFLFNLICK